MRSFLIAFTSVMLVTAGAAQAKVDITIDKDNQQMTVAVDGVARYHWPVSSGIPSRETPNGTFRAFRMEEDHYSKEFDDAPMPHSIFFTKIGHAIHGTDSVSRLGTPASHGCVRMPFEFAEDLFDKTRVGMRVIISPNDATPVEFSHAALLVPNAQAVAAAPAQSNGTSRTCSADRLVAASTAKSCAMVATVESVAPAVAAPSNSGALRARAPIAPIVAVLETKPDAKPEMARPPLAPSRRIETCPAAPVAITRMTIIQIVRGLSAPKGPTA